MAVGSVTYLVLVLMSKIFEFTHVNRSLLPCEIGSCICTTQAQIARHRGVQ